MTKKTKKLTSSILALMLALMLCVPAFAEAQLSYVTDGAGLLTAEEKEALEGDAQQLAEKYGFGVYIITVNDITQEIDAPDMETAAEQLYLTYELGEDQDQSGILLLLSMAERDWALFAFGFGNTAFTDYGKQYLSGHFLDDFGEDGWYDGLEDYQQVCGQMLDSALDGAPIDVDNVPDPPHARLYGVAACTVLGFLVAFIVMAILKRQLKSVAHGTQAEAFVAAGGLKLTQQHDQYIHTTESRVYDPPEQENRSSGGGGTTIRSSGGSSASGKF